MEKIEKKEHPWIAGFSHNVPLHTQEAFGAMRAAGKLAAQCLSELETIITPGISTQDIDDYVVTFARTHKLLCAPFLYRGFPKSCCTSVNHVVCHGIPSFEKILKNGDIVNVDVTFIQDGWHADTNRMYFVGEPPIKARRLCEHTYEAFMRGIQVARPGATLGDIGFAIQSYAEKQGYGVVREFCGHGVGLKFHANPEVLHYGKRSKGLVLQEGMFFTVEPMINEGKAGVKILQDKWTAVTRDRSLSAQFEHSIGIVEGGSEIFTAP